MLLYITNLMPDMPFTVCYPNTPWCIIMEVQVVLYLINTHKEDGQNVYICSFLGSDFITEFSAYTDYTCSIFEYIPSVCC